MSLNRNFSTSQTIGAPSIINITDTSTGSDGSIASRRVTLTKIDSSTLVPSGTTTSYIPWSLASSSIAIDALDRDYCLLIKVEWLDAGGSALYSKTQVCLFTLYSEDFYYSLTQDQSSDPKIIQDYNYYYNKMIMRVQLDSAAQAVDYASDQQSAQDCLDRVYQLILNQNINF